jgi:uncharacterized protein
LQLQESLGLNYDLVAGFDDSNARFQGDVRVQGMSAAQSKPAEPSMEEILASIRRIISDDQAAKAPDAPPQPAAPVAARAPEPAAPVMPAPLPLAPARAAQPVEEDDEDIMDLAPKPLMRKEPEPHMILDDPVDNDLAFGEIEAHPVAISALPPVLSAQSEFDAIMAAAEFDAKPPSPAPLAEAAPPSIERLLSPSTDRVVTTAFSSLATTVLANNARTLENLVEEMMRPMIKTWLDDNLPSIVERLIKAEIERVARGGR